MPLEVADMVPFRVPEIVPDRVPEMVPFWVPEIVPDFANVVVETARANMTAQAMDWAVFISPPGWFRTSKVMIGSTVYLMSPLELTFNKSIFVCIQFKGRATEEATSFKSPKWLKKLILAIATTFRANVRLNF